MAKSAAERKAEQRARAVAGAVSAEAIRKQLVSVFWLKLNFWCLDTTRPEPTVTDVAYEVAEKYPLNQQARVLAYLGIPTTDPDAE